MVEDRLEESEEDRLEEDLRLDLSGDVSLSRLNLLLRLDFRGLLLLLLSSPSDDVGTVGVLVLLK